MCELGVLDSRFLALWSSLSTRAHVYTAWLKFRRPCGDEGDEGDGGQECIIEGDEGEAWGPGTAEGDEGEEQVAVGQDHFCDKGEEEITVG